MVYDVKSLNPLPNHANQKEHSYYLKRMDDFPYKYIKNVGKKQHLSLHRLHFIHSRFGSVRM